eukprot:scaffold1500_cov398-Prasinococcus_capsulatus_cf.AAC.14
MPPLRGQDKLPLRGSHVGAERGARPRNEPGVCPRCKVFEGGDFGAAAAERARVQTRAALA